MIFCENQSSQERLDDDMLRLSELGPDENYAEVFEYDNQNSHSNAIKVQL